MQPVGILKFIDQNKLEALTIVFLQRRISGQQFIAAQQQLGKIDHPFALALLVIRLIKLDLAAGEFVRRLNRVGTQTLILGTVDKPAQFARLEFFVVHIQCFQQPLDGRLLVGRIENLEGLRQIGIAIVRTQQAIAQTVKRADPHAARVDRHHRRQPRQHFLGGLVCKRNRQQSRRADLAGLDEISNAGREDARLAAASARQHERTDLRQRDRF